MYQMKRGDNMMAILVSVVATFLAIWSTFVVGYWIYLKTVQFNLDQEINKIGGEIIEVSKDFHNRQNPFWIQGTELVKHYQKLYETKSYIEILNKIAEDLFGVTIFNSIDEGSEHLKVFANSQLPYYGRIYLFLVGQYMSYVSAETDTTVRSFSRDDNREKKLSLKKEVFPYGQINVYGYLSNFKSMIEPYEILRSKQEVFLQDYQEFLKLTPENDFYQRFDYRQYLQMSDTIICQTKEMITELEKLLNSKRYHSIGERFPSHKWIAFLLCLSFVFGVLFPLVMVGMDCTQIPKTINIIFIVLTFLPMLGSMILCLSDINRDIRKELSIKYYAPLENRLARYYDEFNQYVTFDWEIINQVILNQNEIGLNNKDKQLLTDYRTAVIESNACSDKFINDLVADIKNSQLLMKCKLSEPQGGTGFYLSSIFTCPQKEFPLDQNILIQGQYAQTSLTTTTDFIQLRTPKDAKALQSFNQEFNNILKKRLSGAEYKMCCDKRNMLKNKMKRVIPIMRNRLVG